MSALAEPRKADFERASRELRQSALGLAQAWQALTRAGWSAAQLRPVLLALRQLIKGCDRLRLASLRKRANDLETLLVPFVSELTPQADQARNIEAAVSALTSSVLAVDLSLSLPGFLMANAANDVVVLAKPQLVAKPEVTAVAAKPVSARISDRNTVVVLRAEADLAAGLIDALKERGHRILELSTTQALEQLLMQTMPGAVIADARFLNGISRQLSALKARPGTAEVDAAVVIISDRRDLGRRLLATRHGAVGYFEEPVDVLEVSAVLGLKAPKIQSEPANRALLCTHNQDFAEDCARWLMAANVSTRIEKNVLGALAACLDYAPEILLIDASVKQEEALRLVSELRRHARHAHLPVVLFAGLNSLTQREQAVASGADEYLIEPVKQRHLMSVVTARLERMHRMRQSGASPKNPHGMLSRTEFLSEYARQPEWAMMFLLIDQIDALAASHPISAFDQLDVGIAAMLRPRLKSKELLGYFQDGQYLLALRPQAMDLRQVEIQLEELAEKIRRSVEQSRIDLGNGAERLTASVAWIFPQAEQRNHPKGAEHALHLCRHSVRTLTQGGGNRVRSTLAVELSNPAHPGARADVPVTLQLQPLLCAAGRLHGQYLTEFVWQAADGDTRDYAKAAAQARAAGHIKDFDRRLLLAALNRRAEELKRGRQVRLLLQIGEESLIDKELCVWLTQQLNVAKLSGSGLSLFINIDTVATHANRWQQQMTELHSLGMRVGLLVDSIDQVHLQKLAQLQYDFAILPERPESTPEGSDPFWPQLLRRLRERGSVSIVPGVQSYVEIDQLKSLRVDFVLSDILAPSSETADFDFAGFARS
jgi:DNA-binding response OmpR family regulator/EAL domain-containing protein (putative c-di-GMP-specific phosphodiesterase class I)